MAALNIGTAASRVLHLVVAHLARPAWKNSFPATWANARTARFEIVNLDLGLSGVIVIPTTSGSDID